MCYYIYGALYGDVDKDEYQALEHKYAYKLRCGTKHNVKLSVQENSDEYRVTNWCCDCDSSLGKKDPGADQIKELETLFLDIKCIKGAEYIYLCKTWSGRRNKQEITLKLADIDLKKVLAELHENYLYTFEI